MIIYRAVSAVGREFAKGASYSNVKQDFLFGLFFLTTIKNYFTGAGAQSSLFAIPPDIHKRAQVKRLTLVLDMDETLIYARREQTPPHRNYLQFKHEDGSSFYVQKRPHLHQFLNASAEVFNLILYTAGQKYYADTVMDAIDRQKLIKTRFYRDDCKRYRGSFIKDLRHIKAKLRTEDDLILVDDNEDSIRFNQPFAIAALPFEGDQNDNELPKIFATLLRFYK